MPDRASRPRTISAIANAGRGPWDAFAVLAEAVPVGLFRLAVDSDGGIRIVEANSALVEMLGFESRRQLMAAPVESLYHEFAEVRSAFSSLGQDPLPVDVRLRRRDGRTVIARVRYETLTTEDGLITGYLGVAQDLTDQRHAEDELADEVWEGSQLAATLSTLEAGPDLESTAANVCQALLQLPDVDMAAIYDLSNGGGMPLALRTPPGAPVRSGQPLTRSRTRELKARAHGGPWVNLWHEAHTRYERAWVAAGITASGYMPISWGGRVVGLLVVGSTEADARQTATRWPGRLAEFGAVASALVGGGLVARSRAARMRAKVRNMIAHQRYSPVFQPIVDLATGATAGYEALTRFADGLAPEGWFRRAASIGLRAELEEACLRTALDASHGLGAGWLSVNLSPSLVGEWDRLARDHRNRQLVIEVTEEEAVDDYQLLRHRLSTLRGSVGLAVDDPELDLPASATSSSSRPNT